MDASKYLQLGESQSELVSKLKSLKADELDWYDNEAIKLFEVDKIPYRNNDNLVQQTLGKSPNDDIKKRKGKDYYIANMMVFRNELQCLLEPDFINKVESQNIDNLTIYNYHRILRNLLFDSLVLLNEYTVNLKNQDPPYGCGKSGSQHTLTLYQSLRQSIYGQSSFHSFIEVEPDLSISIIRQLVELRIRRAFGILGWYDGDTQIVEPLSMNKIFEILKKYTEEIDFSIPFNCLVRIYGWSNIFLHTGNKEYSWMHIFITNYLKEFALGKAPSEKGWSVHSGISLNKGILEKIIEELENGNPKGAEVIRLKPEATIIDA